LSDLPGKSREIAQMMGQNGGKQNRLFYSFNLEDHVPPSHLLRGIDKFLDLTDLRAYLAPFYSHTGRPSIDPELMIRMLIVGYCFGIRSERRLCEELERYPKLVRSCSPKIVHLESASIGPRYG
jgi:hypothetical protein